MSPSRAVFVYSCTHLDVHVCWFKHRWSKTWIFELGIDWFLAQFCVSLASLPPSMAILHPATRMLSGHLTSTFHSHTCCQGPISLVRIHAGYVYLFASTPWAALDAICWKSQKSPNQSVSERQPIRAQDRCSPHLQRATSSTTGYIT